MQQIIIIHGGTTFSQYDTYIELLATKPLHIDRLTYQPMWKERLQQTLGDDYQVILPAMPNKTNANYNEWKVWFRHLEDVMSDGCILIGHSLGALFLAKYMSETVFSRNIKATILIAAPYDDEEKEDLTNFKLQTTISDVFTSQAGRTIFFFGSNDPVVPISEMQKYRNDLPTAEFTVMSAPDHFMRVDFPELTHLLQKI